ncbi:MAG: 2OG-Fe(II) oxygenase family protein [Sphingomicrobium sp.]
MELNPELDLANLAANFRANGWIQIRDVLTSQSAIAIRQLLVDDTPWGLSWQAEPGEPQYVPADELAVIDPAYLKATAVHLTRARRSQAYSYAFYSAPLTLAGEAEPATPLQSLFAGLNGKPFLDLMRAVTGEREVVQVDGQATLYVGGHHLAAHTDDVPVQGRRVAYVLSMTMGEWRPEWGGYLNFLDADGDVEVGLRPRFNCLNMFTVPRWHHVAQVLGVAPVARYAVTGWGKDR